MTPKKNYKFNYVHVFVIIMACMIGFFGGKMQNANNKGSKNIDPVFKEIRRSGSYKFINPLIECENFSNSNHVFLKQLEIKVQNFIDSCNSNGITDQIAFYYRDLNNGPWIGLREEEKFAPASLLKVPNMIAILKMEENNPGFMQKEIVLSREMKDGLIPTISDSLIVIGKKYTLEELVKHMIIFSDNWANDLLLGNISMDLIDSVYVDMGLNIDFKSGTKDIMSVRDYSSFFRILYNSTYLSKANSEKALRLLSESKFKDGIVKYLPSDIIVSHKFGERAFDNSNIKQLHECGIVYKENNPYLICIMTKAKNFKESAEAIARISKMVYYSK